MSTITQTTRNGTAAQPNGNVASYEKLSKGMKSTATLPLWEQMKRLNPPLPEPRTVPHIWKYDDVRPLLLQAGQLVTEKQAERRVLMLVNPARNEAPFTTDTLYAGLQLVMPHETAPAHRHTAFAMRFIIEGSGGFTAVHGKRVPMRRGDVILTPTWNWHDHGNHGEEPMIWLDGLDLPNFVHFPVHFVEHYQHPRYPAEEVDVEASPIVFPWEGMRRALDAVEGPWASLPYLKGNGQEVSRIIGGSAERLDPGKTSPVFRETSSAVYHVVEGSGCSEINGEKIGWKRGDTFCIPSWYQYQHFASPDETVYLYRFDDKPMLKALGFYRTVETSEEALLSD
ncbi:hypothetical protein MPH_09077 [Macrophomina phaseolina MS6]|uniref:Cupin type-2 domain-containing protein n=1 Tax=Macrophomina phaseolina (strain MS6) TaxID=1126212 RepID=K2RGP2_MACPH|nr:hypothetical protein MPH_09077 [Macrophomina phaseolina MS6]